jgi:hypothetical protein
VAIIHVVVFCNLEYEDISQPPKYSYAPTTLHGIINQKAMNALRVVRRGGIVEYKYIDPKYNGHWKTLYNEELQNSYSLPNIKRIVKRRADPSGRAVKGVGLRSLAY